jgi:hypothetical protein
LNFKTKNQQIKSVKPPKQNRRGTHPIIGTGTGAPLAPAPQPTEEERKRATEAEMTRRIDTIVEMLLSGTRRSEILEFSGVQWHLERSQTDEYIAEATKLIKAEAAKDRDEAFDEHILIRRKLRKMAESDKDWRAALAAAQDEAKLRDLYPAEKRRLEGTITTTTAGSEELAKMRQEIDTARQQVQAWEEKMFAEETAETKTDSAAPKPQENKDAP